MCWLFWIRGCISFYPAKTLGCFGDGGLVLTNDDEIYNKIILMRDHGRSKMVIYQFGVITAD